MNEEMVKVRYGLPGTLPEGYVKDTETGISYRFKAKVPIEVPARFAKILTEKKGSPWKLSSSVKAARRTKAVKKEKKEGGD